MNRFIPNNIEENSSKISGHEACMAVHLLVIHSDHLIWFSKQGD